MLAGLGLTFVESDTPDDHPYRLRTPVLLAGGEVVAEGHIDPALIGRLRGKMRR
jgi:hypothetical protein